MTPSSRAVEIIEAERARDKDVVHLACLMSIAAQIEPELVRAMRLAAMPTTHAAIEADLWFSSLVQAHDLEGLVFLPDVTECLRAQLAASGNNADFERAWNVISTAHVKHSPMLLLEESATHMALRTDAGSYDSMERELGR